MSTSALTTDAAVESIAQSIASVISSAVTEGMRKLTSQPKRHHVRLQMRCADIGAIWLFCRRLSISTGNECMRLMGAREELELKRSLKSAISAILARKSIPLSAECPAVDGEVDVIAESLLKGRRVYPLSSLDKLLDSMVDEMISNASKTSDC